MRALTEASWETVARFGRESWVVSRELLHRLGCPGRANSTHDSRLTTHDQTKDSGRALSDLNVLRHHYRHFNAAALIDAADGYRAHLDAVAR